MQGLVFYLQMKPPFGSDGFRDTVPEKPGETFTFAPV